jgi:hypothetical protein
LTQLLRQPLALTPEHRAFFFGPRTAPTQHVALAGFAFGLFDQAHFESVLHRFPVGLFQQRLLVGAQPALRRADQISRFARAQESDVRLGDHAPVHHPDAFGLAVFFLPLAHGGLDGAHIGAVAGKHLEAERQALRRADQADADLFVAAALVARVAALGLGIAPGLTFKIRARHIVEQKLETHAEPLAVTRHEVSAQRVLMRAEVIERAVEPVVVDRGGVHAEQVVQRGGFMPMLGHAEFGALRAKPRDREQRRRVCPAHLLAAGG